MLLEVGVFARRDRAGRTRVVQRRSAAHQIAIHMASVTFMILYGLASAAAVRVGHAIGREGSGRRRRGRLDRNALGVGFMGAAAAGVSDGARRT